MAEYNNGYTQAQIMAMQKDAMNRVNQMQRLSREKLNSSLNNAPLQQPRPSQPPQPTAERRPDISNEPPSVVVEPPREEILPSLSCETEIVHNGLEGILDKLNLDDEKIILILLLILLVNEGADYMLILALVYVLL